MNPETPLQKAQRWRGFLAFVLLTLSILCLVLGSLFVWMRVSAFQPDGYVASALQVEGRTLLREKVVQYVEDDLLPQDRANQLAEQAVSRLPVNDTQRALLATGISTAVRSQVGNAVNAFLDSRAGQDISEAITSRLSEEIVALVRNEPGIFQFEGDAIVLDTTSIAQKARSQVEAALGDFAAYLPPPREGVDRTITLVQGDYVVTIQDAISIIWTLAWVLPLLFAVLLIAGIITARDRRGAAFRAMIAIVVAVIITTITIRIARGVISGLVSDPATQDVVDAILGSATKDLISQTLWVSFFAALIGGGLWLLGPDKPARHARGWIAARWHDLRTGTASDAGRVTEFARTYRRHLEIGGLIIAAIVLIAMSSIGLATWILALVAIAVWFTLIEYAACAGWMQSVANWIAGLRRQPAA